LQLLTRRKLRARPDDQACPTARPGYVCVSHVFYRSPSPGCVLGTTLPTPFDRILNPSRRTSPAVAPDHGERSAIESP
jgi:hypothetical protein